MKTLFFSLIASLALAISVVSAETSPTTNAPATVEIISTNTTPATLQATLNDVVIDILRGAKSASSEVYNASKSAVVASVDFAKQQVPDVVEQFLRWKITERVVYVIGWLVVAIFLVYLSRRFSASATKIETNNPEMFKGKYYSTPADYDFVMWGKWLTRIAAIAIIVINVWMNGMEIAKIVIAPKVYLIEYVVDTINYNRRHNGN
jgi:hypothetical protein